jgi:hypothetical protein
MKQAKVLFIFYFRIICSVGYFGKAGKQQKKSFFLQRSGMVEKKKY